MDKGETTMDENNKKNPEPEMNEALEAALEEETRRREAKMNNIKDRFAQNVFRHINYKALFTLCDQLDQYEDFKAYTVEYEKMCDEKRKAYEAECAACKERGEGMPEAPDFDPPRPWTDFLDEKAATVENLGRIYDSMLASATNIAMGAAEVIHAGLYEEVVGPQFQNTQQNFEKVFGALGEVFRRLENVEKKTGVDPMQGVMKPPAHPADPKPEQ